MKPQESDPYWVWEAYANRRLFRLHASILIGLLLLNLMVFGWLLK